MPKPPKRRAADKRRRRKPAQTMAEKLGVSADPAMVTLFDPVAEAAVRARFRRFPTATQEQWKALRPSRWIK